MMNRLEDGLSSHCSCLHAATRFLRSQAKPKAGYSPLEPSRTVWKVRIITCERWWYRGGGGVS